MLIWLQLQTNNLMCWMQLVSHLTQLTGGSVLHTNMTNQKRKLQLVPMIQHTPLCHPHIGDPIRILGGGEGVHHPPVLTVLAEVAHFLGHSKQ